MLTSSKQTNSEEYERFVYICDVPTTGSRYIGVATLVSHRRTVPATDNNRSPDDQCLPKAVSRAQGLTQYTPLE